MQRSGLAFLDHLSTEQKSLVLTPNFWVVLVLLLVKAFLTALPQQTSQIQNKKEGMCV